MDTPVLMTMLSIVVGFAAAFLMGKWLIPRLRALKAGQEIREVGPKWHNSKAGTPTMGGLCFIFASAFSAVTGWYGYRTGDYTHLLVLALAVMFVAIGFYDDYIKVKKHRNLGLTGLQKLLLQIAAAAIFLLALHFTGELKYDLYIPFVRQPVAKVPTVLYLAVAVFVIVGCVNAVNLTDGIDGLASGVTLPVMVFFTVTALGKEKFGLAAFPATLAGGLIGFLFYNFYPAQVFMGDTGSLFLGGAVVGLAFALDMPLVLLLVGLIYIIETLSDILQVGYFKLTHGKRIFKMAPIHHHFEMCGWSETRVVAVFSIVTAILCLLAYLGL